MLSGVVENKYVVTEGGLLYFASKLTTTCNYF